MTKEIVDKYGRTFKTLRLSLTNTCNLGCVYCTSGIGKEEIPPENNLKNILNSDQLVTAVKKIDELIQLKTVRLTGGEPTLYKELIPLIKKIKSIGIDHIKMTSNGYLLKNMLPALAAAGLDKINISLDAVDPESFYKISRRKDLNRILDAIDLALSLGIEIKINMVVMRTFNEDQVIPLLNYSAERKISVRFLELMKMGPLHTLGNFDDYFVSEKEILTKIEEAHKFQALPREPSATANYWETSEGYKFGIIANDSHPFCQDCDRLRLDSFGNIFGCLSSDTAISISDCINDPEILSEKMQLALSHKQVAKFKGSKISMLAIGG